jgi:hypothetical protein
MHRLFGTKKPAPPPGPPAPSLEETVGKYDTRITGLDGKVTVWRASLRSGTQRGCNWRIGCVSDCSPRQGACWVPRAIETTSTQWTGQRKSESHAGTVAENQQRSIVAGSHIGEIRDNPVRLQALKRKKMYEQQRDTMLKQSFSVEQVRGVVNPGKSAGTALIFCVCRATWFPSVLPGHQQTHFALESIKDTQAMVGAMKEAASALKTEHGKIDLDELEDVQDDLEEAFYITDEVNELLTRSYGGCVQNRRGLRARWHGSRVTLVFRGISVPNISDAELDAELAGLQDEWAAEGEAVEGVPRKDESAGDSFCVMLVILSFCRWLWLRVCSTRNACSPCCTSACCADRPLMRPVLCLFRISGSCFPLQKRPASPGHGANRLLHPITMVSSL